MICWVCLLVFRAPWQGTAIPRYRTASSSGIGPEPGPPSILSRCGDGETPQNSSKQEASKFGHLQEKGGEGEGEGDDERGTEGKERSCSCGCPHPGWLVGGIGSSPAQPARAAEGAEQGLIWDSPPPPPRPRA